MSCVETHRELLRAAEAGALDKVQQLLAMEEVEINFQDDSSGDTVLHCAARSGSKELVKFLAAKPELDTSKENRQGMTPMDIARDKSCWFAIAESVLRRAKDCLKPSVMHPVPISIPRQQSFIEATTEGDFDYQLSPQNRSLVIRFITQTRPSSKKPLFCVYLRASESLMLTITHDGKNIGCAESTPQNHIIENAEYTREMKMKYSSNCEIFAILVTYVIKGVCDLWLSQKENQGKSRQNEKLFDTIDGVIKRLEQQTSSQNYFGRVLIANIMNEITRTEKKIEFCVSSLQEITSLGCPSFTKRACVVLFQFLETFALEDTHPVIKMNKKDEDDLKKMKKNYFLRFYPKGKLPDGKCFGCIKNFRNFLIHNTRNDDNMIETDDFDRMIILEDSATVDSFFKDLLKFTKILSGNIGGAVQAVDGKDVSDSLCKYFTKFESKDNVNIQWDKGITFDDVLGRFSRYVADMVSEKSHSLVDDVLFDLFFNINPRLETRTIESKRLVQVRKVAAHAFPEANPQYLKHELSFAVPELYRQRLSDVAYDKIKHFDVDEDANTMLRILHEALLTVTKKFKSYKLLLPLLENERCLGTTGEGHIREGRNRWPDASKVKKYIKYMAHLLDRSDPGDGDEPMHTEIKVSHKDGERLEMFESFLRLDNALVAGNTESQQEQKHLMRCLQCDFGLIRKDAEWVLATALAHDIFIPDNLVKRVDDSLRTLKNIFRTRYIEGHKILDHCAIQLYESYITGASKFKIEQIDCLQLLNSEEKKMIESTLAELYNTDLFGETIQFGGKRLKVSVSSIVINVMKMSVQKYSLHQVEFETVQEAFHDDIFLSFLINHDTQAASCGTYQVNDFNQVYRNVRLMRKLDFTGIYIAKLIIRVQNAKHVEYKTLEKLVRLLIQDVRCLPTFIELLNIRDRKVMKAVFNTIIFTDVSDEKLHVILRTLADGRLLEGCFPVWIDVLKKKVASADAWLRTFFTISNDVARECERQNNFGTALALLDDVEKFYEKLIRSGLFEANVSIVTAGLINKAHVKSSEGFWYRTYDKKQGQVRARQLYEEALTCLCRVPEDTPPGEYMLYLSTKSFIYGSLFSVGRVQLHAQESYKIRRRMWTMMWQYISGEDSAPPPFDAVYKRAASSSRYQSLLDRGPAYRYLDVCRIRNSLLKCRYFCLVADSSPGSVDGLLSLLAEWEELRDVRKREAKATGDEFKTLLSILTLKEKSKVHKAVADIWHSEGNWCGAHFHLIKMIEMNLLRYKEFAAFSGRCDSNTLNCLNDLKRNINHWNWKSSPWRPQRRSGHPYRQPYSQTRPLLSEQHFDRATRGARPGARLAGVCQDGHYSVRPCPSPVKR